MRATRGVLTNLHNNYTIGLKNQSFVSQEIVSNTDKRKLQMICSEVNLEIFKFRENHKPAEYRVVLFVSYLKS